MIINNINIVLSNTIVKNGAIQIENGLITNIYEESIFAEKVIDGNGYNLFPGFIDIHTHGGYGHDFCDKDSLSKICNELVKEGVTGVCPTTITAPINEINKILENINANNSTKTKVLGIHLEGPFLTESKKGAHNNKYFVDPTPNIIDLVNNNVKIVSYAIEHDLDKSFTKYLQDNNIVASVAHSNALADEVKKSIVHGLKSVTHIFNGQSGVSHRNGGVALAGLVCDELYTEVISDLIHIDEYCLQLIYKSKPKDKIILITDAMRAKGLENGTYFLGDIEVKLENDCVKTKSGSLAGSILKMNDALRNFQKVTKCSLSELALFSATNPAKLLNLPNTGEIAIGYVADLVLVDSNFNVIKTIINGEIVFEN